MASKKSFNLSIFLPRFSETGPSLNFSKGFTLIEMMTVIVIATIVITALVVQQNKWNDQLTVSTQAYELALMIRQAQIYSLGVREDTGGGGDRFNVGYGVFVDVANPSQFFFFADRNKNLKMDSGEEIAADTKVLNRGVLLNRICGVNPGNQEKCSSDGDNNGNLYKISISFLRPETRAVVLPLNSGGNNSNAINPPIKIYLRSPGGREASVNVDVSGQISINQ